MQSSRSVTPLLFELSLGSRIKSNSESSVMYGGGLFYRKDQSLAYRETGEKLERKYPGNFELYHALFPWFLPARGHHAHFAEHGHPISISHSGRVCLLYR
jgi:hypothetical protein